MTPTHILTLLLCLCLLIVSSGCTQQRPVACIDMNGNDIHPNPELCKYACNARGTDAHMQAHYGETCGCCNYMNIDYSYAGEYQERVYVLNSDESNGEDITCSYYPNASGCKK